MKIKSKSIFLLDILGIVVGFLLPILGIVVGFLLSIALTYAIVWAVCILVSYPMLSLTQVIAIWILIAVLRAVVRR